MKTLNTIKIALGLLCACTLSTLQAQTVDELFLFSGQDYQGTARFSGMGGAFNALGGDFGSLSTNPAGVAVFRKSEFSFTPTVTVTKTSSDYLGMNTSENRTRFGLSNVGYVGVYGTGKDYGVVSYNLAIGYNKTNDFFKFAPMAGNGSKSSISDEYAGIANDFFSFDDQAFIVKGDESNVYRDFDAGQWLSVAAVRTGLVNNYYDPSKPTNDPQNPNPDQYFSTVDAPFNQFRDISQRGSVGEYVFSGGINISNKIYIGATMGLQDLNYEKETYFEEVGFNQDKNYNMKQSEFLRVDGTGYNFKLGVIVRPVDAFRVGLAVHTPTFYDMEDSYSINMNTNTNEFGKWGTTSNVNISQYRLQTPYRLETGIAYVIGKYGIISIDYEMVDNSSMRYRNDNDRGYERELNDVIKSTYRASSNIKVGAEVNLGYGFMLRGGFNYLQSPYKGSYNDNASYVYSTGIGYRNDNFFVDFATSTYISKLNSYLYSEADDFTEKIQKSRIMLTAGIKF